MSRSGNGYSCRIWRERAPLANVGNMQAGVVGTEPVAARPTIQVVPLRGLPIVAYVISAGMIGFAFVKDHARGAPLAAVLVMPVIFALDVPLIIAFTVAPLLLPSRSCRTCT